MTPRAPDTAWDVVVVGGGSAGLGAALGAARAGARTLLLERYGFLGGMATAGMVGTVCGLYATGREGAPELLNEGVAGEVAARLIAADGSRPVRHGRTVVLPYTPPAFAAVADALVTATAGLTLRLHATCIAVDQRTARITGLRVFGPDGPYEIGARAVVDTTGDAMVALLADLPTDTMPEEARQLPSLVFTCQQVDQQALHGPAVLAVIRELQRAEAAGELPRGAGHASLRASTRPGEVVMKLTLDHVPTRSDDVTDAAIEGRRRVHAVVTHLQRTVPAFHDAFVSHTAPQVGVRERRRLVGRQQLTRDDVLSARRFPDAVARAAWPIELWEPGRVGARYEYLDDGAWYEISRGCLESAACDNLFTAGRCFSATHEAMGSARVMGTCLAVGEAAGRLAAARSGA